MSYEISHNGINIIGYNKPIRFYNPSRSLKAEIFLQTDDQLNTGGLSGVAAGGTGGTTSAHGLGDLAVHTGTLINNQAPQFLLLTGTRGMLGNLNMNSNEITNIAIATLANEGLHLLDTNASHDLIIKPGSDLTADRIFTITTGDAARTLSMAGDLTISSGGTLALATFTLTIPATGTAAVGAGTLTVSSANDVANAAHLHAITSSSNPGAAASVLASDASGYLELEGLGIGTAATAQEIRLDGDLVFVGAQSITTTAGNLTLAPAGDLVLAPVGNDVLPGTPYDINLGALTNKYLTLHAAELWVETLVAQDTMATIGGRILVGPTTMLTSDLTDVATTLYVKHNNLASGDRVVMQADGKLEWMSIDSAAGGAGPYTYTVTRNLDGSGGNVWYAGDAVFNTGTTSDGFIDLYSVAGVTAGSTAGPTIAGQVRYGTTYNEYREAWAIGNLNGLYGYGADTYGVGLGQYSAADYVTIDATNGVRFLDSSDVVQAQLTSSVWTMGEVGAGLSNIEITAGTLNLRSNTTDMLTLNTAGQLLINGWGDNPFSMSGGLLLLGPNCPMTATSWTTLRNQAATISGAFHTVNGRWTGTRALMVEEGSVNLIVDPVLGEDAASWAAYGTTISRSSEQSRYEGYSLKVVTGGGAYHGADYTPNMTVGATTWHTASTWVYCVTAGVPMSFGVEGDVSGWSNTTFTSLPGWQRVSHTFNTAATETQLLNIRIQNNNDTTVHTFYVDMLQLEYKHYATSDCYGGLVWCAWSGADDASTSTRAATECTLDAYASLMSDNNTWSLSLWWQPQYDSDADWPDSSNLFDVRGADDNNRIILEYDDDDDKYNVFINGGWRFQSPAQTFSAGDWQYVLLTLNFTTDAYTLYVNGAAAGSDTTALTAPAALAEMNLGTSYIGAGSSTANAAYNELALFDSVLTAEEAAAIYQSGKPLTDQGATDTPGIYILDGQFKIASSTSGQRIEITADEIAGYSSAGVKQFYLQSSDGKAYAGAGTVMLDADGLTITTSTSSPSVDVNRLKFVDGSDNTSLYIHSIESGGENLGGFFVESLTGMGSQLWLNAECPAGDSALGKFSADSGSAAEAAVQLYSTAAGASYVTVAPDLRVADGLYVGSTGTDPDADDVWCDGEISTDGGTTKWNLGGYTATPPTVDGYLEVVVEGTTYRIAVDAQ